MDEKKTLEKVLLEIKNSKEVIDDFVRFSESLGYRIAAFHRQRRLDLAKKLYEMRKQNIM